jgi:GNAT superfamily N-acetyltransferase
VASYTVRSSSDPALALGAGAPLLLARPEHNSVLLTVLAEHGVELRKGRYWWACREGDVVAFAMQSPGGFRAVLATADAGAVAPLADRMAMEAPDLPGVMGEAAAAAAFAGRWSEVRAVPVRPVEAQRIHRVRSVRSPAGITGRLRRAQQSERDVATVWSAAFLRDTGSNPFDPGELVERHLGSGRLWVWVVQGEPVSMAAVSATAGGVARIAFVYTPPEHRRNGYAAACVAALSERVLAGGDGCILYTQLHNTTSNGVYRRIGYEPIADVLIYRFGTAEA